MVFPEFAAHNDYGLNIFYALFSLGIINKTMCYWGRYKRTQIAAEFGLDRQLQWHAAALGHSSSSSTLAPQYKNPL